MEKRHYKLVQLSGRQWHWKGGKERIYATIPVDIWWYDDASQTNFKTKAPQIMVHEIINTIRGTLQMSPYYCTAPTGTAGDPSTHT